MQRGVAGVHGGLVGHTCRVAAVVEQNHPLDRWSWPVAAGHARPPYACLRGSVRGPNAGKLPESHLSRAEFHDSRRVSQALPSWRATMPPCRSRKVRRSPASPSSGSWDPAGWARCTWPGIPDCPARTRSRYCGPMCQPTANTGHGSTAKPMPRRRCGIHTSSPSTTAASSTASSGSTWTSSTAPTPYPFSGIVIRTGCPAPRSPRSSLRWPKRSTMPTNVGCCTATSNPPTS
ncbi:Uncharacterised protein [Mycobacterium tuberculosis]|nr:Uncharacterised protein [Mycobacterium tuberculosis]